MDSLWLWAAFIFIVSFLLALDLGVLHKKDSQVGIKANIIISLFYISLGLLFGIFVWHNFGYQKAEEYITGFLIEKSLSLDNIFVISLVFNFFAIPPKHQHKILFWGILGALIFRGIFIALGSALLGSFAWIIHVFEVFLVFTGIKLLIIANQQFDVSQTAIFRFFKKYFNIVDDVESGKFYVLLNNRLYITPLFIALFIIEFVDLIFAIDSLPAIFAITSDPYIVYTSNIFAILGLRSLYFVLSQALLRFSYLKISLSIILIFIGSKNYIAKIFGLCAFPTQLSLIIVISIMSIGIIYSKSSKRL